MRFHLDSLANNAKMASRRLSGCLGSRRFMRRQEAAKSMAVEKQVRRPLSSQETKLNPLRSSSFSMIFLIKCMENELNRLSAPHFTQLFHKRPRLGAWAAFSALHPAPGSVPARSHPAAAAAAARRPGGAAHPEAPGPWTRPWSLHEQREAVKTSNSTRLSLYVDMNSMAKVTVSRPFRRPSVALVAEEGRGPGPPARVQELRGPEALTRGSLRTSRPWNHLWLQAKAAGPRAERLPGTHPQAHPCLRRLQTLAPAEMGGHTRSDIQLFRAQSTLKGTTTAVGA